MTTIIEALQESIWQEVKTAYLEGDQGLEDLAWDTLDKRLKALSNPDLAVLLSFSPSMQLRRLPQDVNFLASSVISLVRLAAREVLWEYLQTHFKELEDSDEADEDSPQSAEL
jgi:adenylate cyclase